MGKNKALMATTLLKDLTRLIERHGDLPVLTGQRSVMST